MYFLFLHKRGKSRLNKFNVNNPALFKSNYHSKMAISYLDAPAPQLVTDTSKHVPRLETKPKVNPRYFLLLPH